MMFVCLFYQAICFVLIRPVSKNVLTDRERIEKPWKGFCPSTTISLVSTPRNLISHLQNSPLWDGLSSPEGLPSLSSNKVGWEPKPMLLNHLADGVSKQHKVLIWKGNSLEKRCDFDFGFLLLTLVFFKVFEGVGCDAIDEYRNVSSWVWWIITCLSQTMTIDSNEDLTCFNICLCLCVLAVWMFWLPCYSYTSILLRG